MSRYLTTLYVGTQRNDDKGVNSYKFVRGVLDELKIDLHLKSPVLGGWVYGGRVFSEISLSYEGFLTVPTVVKIVHSAPYLLSQTSQYSLLLTLHKFDPRDFLEYARKQNTPEVYRAVDILLKNTSSGFLYRSSSIGSGLSKHKEISDVLLSVFGGYSKFLEERRDFYLKDLLRTKYDFINPPNPDTFSSLLAAKGFYESISTKPPELVLPTLSKYCEARARPYWFLFLDSSIFR